MSDIFSYEFIVSKDALDENGHVNNVEYVRWMQEAAIKHSDYRGCTEATKALGALWVVRSHNIEYLQPAFAGDSITVNTWVSNFRKVRSLRKYKILRKKDNVVLARGATDWVFIDAESGSPRHIPLEVSGLFELVTDEQ